MRNRTKQHIQRLEKEIAEQKAQRQTIEDLQRRNRALEDELIHIKDITSLYLPPDIALPASILGTMPDSAALTPREGLQTYNFDNDGSQYTLPLANWEGLGVCTGQGTAVTNSSYTHGTMPDSAALTLHQELKTYNDNVGDEGSLYTRPSANWEELRFFPGQGTAVTYTYTHGHGTYCNSTSIENPSLFFNDPDLIDIRVVADSHHGGIAVRLQDIRPDL